MTENKFGNLQNMLGDNFIGEEPIDLGDLLVIVAAKELSGKKNFSDSNITELLNYPSPSSRKEENSMAETLRQKLLRLNWSPNKTVVDAIVESGKKCNPNEIVFAYQQNFSTDLPQYIWLEIGNTKKGLVHIIKRRYKEDGHFFDLTRKSNNLTTFTDLFNMIEGLLTLGKCKVVKDEPDEPCIDIRLERPVVWKNLSIKTSDFKLPIGDNGFMVTFFPTQL